MSDLKPVSLSIFDNDERTIFECSVGFTVGITAREALEQAFVANQSTGHPDPFAVTFTYFGYSYSEDFPGYLGYEIEGFGPDVNHLLLNNPDFYWELNIDGKAATLGSDLTRPQPGGSLVWRYTPTGSPSSSPRAAAHAQRFAR